MNHSLSLHWSSLTLNGSVLLHNPSGAAASGSFADWTGAPQPHVPEKVHRPFGGSGGSNVFAPMQTRESPSHSSDGSSNISSYSSSRGVASNHSFDAAIGPLWLQTLASYAGPAHADGALGGTGSTGSACERRVIFNCEISNVSAAPLHSDFNVSLGLSNGEAVRFYSASSEPSLFKSI